MLEISSKDEEIEKLNKEIQETLIKNKKNIKFVNFLYIYI